MTHALSVYCVRFILQVQPLFRIKNINKTKGNQNWIFIAITKIRISTQVHLISKDGDFTLFYK